MIFSTFLLQHHGPSSFRQTLRVKEVNVQKKKVVKAKTQVKNTSNAKKVTGDFKKKYRRKK